MRRTAALVSMLASVVCVAGPIHDDWKLVRQDDALEVWTRHVPNSQFDAVRVGGNICTSLDVLTRYVQDVDRFVEWIPDTAEAHMLAQPSAFERIYYIRTAMPWPVKDRDMIYRLVSEPEAHPRTIEIDGIPDYLPVRADAVRMASVEGAWHIEPRSAQLTHVTVEMRIEPGGNVPTWFARRRIVALPTGMIQNLERKFSETCDTTPSSG